MGKILTDEEVIAKVKELTGCESVRIERKGLSVWNVLLSFPDGPDAYHFVYRMVDVEGEEIKMVGFNW